MYVECDVGFSMCGSEYKSSYKPPAESSCTLTKRRCLASYHIESRINGTQVQFIDALHQN